MIEAGFITAPDGYFKTAIEIIHKYGGVFISDEVQTGFGRTGGKMWGIEHHGGKRVGLAPPGGNEGAGDQAVGLGEGD